MIEMLQIFENLIALIIIKAVIIAQTKNLAQTFPRV